MNYNNAIKFVMHALLLVYLVFLVMYLNDAKKTDMYMSKQNQNVRQVALVVTWIMLILSGLKMVVCLGKMAGINLPQVPSSLKVEV